MWRDIRFLADCVGFDWDESNLLKNWEKHQVTQDDAEEVFFLDPLLIRADARHSWSERRYYALGCTQRGRRLFVAFTIRRDLIRVISARDMNRRERQIYGRQEETAS